MNKEVLALLHFQSGIMKLILFCEAYSQHLLTVMVPEMAASLASCRAKSCVSVSLTFLLRLLPSLWLMTTWGKGEQGNAGGLSNWESLFQGTQIPQDAWLIPNSAFISTSTLPTLPADTHSYKTLQVHFRPSMFGTLLWIRGTASAPAPTCYLARNLYGDGAGGAFHVDGAQKMWNLHKKKMPLECPRRIKELNVTGPDGDGTPGARPYPQRSRWLQTLPVKSPSAPALPFKPLFF